MDRIIEIVLNGAAQIDQLQEYGIGIYLIVVFVIGFCGCYAGIWFFCSAFWVIGGIVGGTAGALMVSGDSASIIATVIGGLVGTVVGAIIFAMLFAFGIVILGGMLGLIVGALTGNEIAIVLMTLVGAVAAVKLVIPFIICLSSFTGGTSLTYVFLNVGEYLESGSTKWDGGLASYMAHIIKTLFKSGSDIAINELKIHLTVLFLTILTGVVVQVYTYYFWKKPEKILVENETT